MALTAYRGLNPKQIDELIDRNEAKATEENDGIPEHLAMFLQCPVCKYHFIIASDCFCRICGQRLK